MSLPYFPASVFSGLQLNVTRIDSYDNIVSIAASGRRSAATWREIPLSTFEITWDFLDHNDANIVPSQDGSQTFTEYDTLRGFFNAQTGGLTPFYLKLSDLTKKPADSQVTGQQIGTGDGVTTNFQLIRTVGIFSEPIQVVDPAGVVNVYVNGALKVAGTDYTLGSTGIVSFTAAPAANAIITADIQFVYLVNFDSDDGEWEQIYYLLYTCKSLKLKSVIL